VGDRYVLEAMIEGGYVLGGEQSGHIIFSEYNTTGDGLISALQFLRLMVRGGKTSVELASTMKILPQVLTNARVANDKKYSYTGDPVISKEISRVEGLLEGSGRVLIRPSGTEPRIRVMLEGPDLELLQREASVLAELIASRLS